jgi:hypothetical protein
MAAYVVCAIDFCSVHGLQISLVGPERQKTLATARRRETSTTKLSGMRSVSALSHMHPLLAKAARVMGPNQIASAAHDPHADLNALSKV